MVDQETFPSSIVIIHETYTPTGVLHGHAAESRRIAVIGKRAIAVVPIKRVHLAGEGGNYQVWQTIVVVVREIYPHACVGVALAIVVIHQGGNRAISIRVAVGTVTLSTLATPGIVKVPLQVSKYD